MHFTQDSFEKSLKLKNTSVPNIIQYTKIESTRIKTKRKRLNFDDHNVDHNYAKQETNMLGRDHNIGKLLLLMYEK